MVLKSDCQKCALLKANIPFKPVMPYMPQNAELPILFVGEAPGETEAITGIPFTGGAGKMLFALLQNAGISKKHNCFTNVCLCRPPENRKPYPAEILACQPNLTAVIDLLQPRLIIALGDTAAYALTGKSQIVKLRGSFDKYALTNGVVIPILYCLHPAFIMRQRQWINIAVNDFKKVHDFLQNGLAVNTNQFTFLADPCLDDLAEYLRPSDNPIAFDTETTGLDVKTVSLIGISFSRDANSAAACQLKYDDNRIPLIQHWLESPQAKCTQNGVFDISVIKQQWHIDVNGLVFDTRVAEQLINSDLPTNLDHLRATYTDIPSYKPKKSEMKNIKSWTPETLIDYACRDALVTYQVMTKQKSLMDDGTKTALNEILMPIISIISDMTLKGVKVDRDKLALAYSSIGPELEAMKDAIIAYYEVNPNSPLQIIKRFDVKSSDKETLTNAVMHGHKHAEAFKDILAYRQLDSVAKLLIGMFKLLHTDLDGVSRLHTTYHPDGTGTGRLSSSDPNLQNITKSYRWLFEADNDDYLLIAGDFKQMELHVAALLSNCEVMLNGLNSGTDIHALTQADIEPFIPKVLDKNVIELTPRRIAKTVVFGTLYGATPFRFARQFGVSVQTAEKWQSVIFAKYPELKTYIKNQIEMAEKHGFVTTPFGRKRYLTEPNKAVNTPIQSAASDVTLTTMIELNRLGFDMRLNVHDEIVCQIPRHDWQKHYQIMLNTFTRPIKQFNGYRFSADFKIGRNWGEMKEINAELLNTNDLF